MSLRHRLRAPRTRRLVAVGNVCLATSLSLRLFVHPSNPLADASLHALSGFLLGLSIVISLSALRRPRPCKWLEPNRDDSMMSR
jgi:hypothetical protein